MTLTAHNFYLLLASLRKYDGQHSLRGAAVLSRQTVVTSSSSSLPPRRPAGSRQVSERRPASGSMRSGFGLLPAVHSQIQARGGLHLTDVVQGKVILTVTIITIHSVFTKVAWLRLWFNWF